MVKNVFYFVPIKKKKANALKQCKILERYFDWGSRIKPLVLVPTLCDLGKLSFIL